MPSISQEDWLKKTETTCSLANNQIHNSSDVRAESQKLRNCVDVQTYWDTVTTNTTLNSRVNELNAWLIELKICIDQICREINFLRVEKERTEDYCDALDDILNIVAQSLTLRDFRDEPELTNDEVSAELDRELKLVQSNKKMLMDLCKAAWLRFNQLTKVKSLLEIDLDCKNQARNCDDRQLMLRDSNEASLKTTTSRDEKK